MRYVTYTIGEDRDGVTVLSRGRRRWRVGSPDDFDPSWPLEVKQGLVVCLSEPKP